MARISAYNPSWKYNGKSYGKTNYRPYKSRVGKAASGGRGVKAASFFKDAAVGALGMINPMAGAAATAGLGLYNYINRDKEVAAKRRRFGNGRWTGYIKRKRVRNKRKVRKVMNNAFQVSVERSFTQTPSVAGIVGHATGSRSTYLRAVFGAMLRRLFVRAGISCAIPSQNLFPMKIGTVITCTFTYGSTSNDGWSVSIGSVPITFTQVLDAFVSAFTGKYDALSATIAPGNIRLRNLTIEGTAVAGGVSTVSLDISDAKVSLWCTSRLKMQNRSVNTAGDDDADDVDNVPINCVAYSGYGTGCDSKYDYLNVNLCCDGNAVMSLSDPVNLGDAPIPQTFRGVRKSGFFRVQPGNIQTDVIKFKKMFTLDSIIRMLAIPRGDSNIRVPIGKFTFIHLEKTLEANNAAPVAMSIACENQLFIDCKFYMNNSDIPVPEFFRS